MMIVLEGETLNKRKQKLMTEEILRIEQREMSQGLANQRMG